MSSDTMTEMHSDSSMEMHHAHRQVTSNTLLMVLHDSWSKELQAKSNRPEELWLIVYQFLIGIDREYHPYEEGYQPVSTAERLVQMQLLSELFALRTNLELECSMGIVREAMLFTRFENHLEEFAPHRQMLLNKMGSKMLTPWFLFWFIANPELLRIIEASLGQYQALCCRDDPVVLSALYPREATVDQQGNCFLHYLALNTYVSPAVWSIVQIVLKEYPSLNQCTNYKLETFMHIYVEQVLLRSNPNAETASSWGSCIGSELADIVDQRNELSETPLSKLIIAHAETSIDYMGIVTGLIHTARSFRFPNTTKTVRQYIENRQYDIDSTSTDRQPLQRYYNALHQFLSLVQTIEILNRGLYVYQHAIASNISETLADKCVYTARGGFEFPATQHHPMLYTPLHDSVYMVHNSIAMYNIVFGTCVVVETHLGKEVLTRVVLHFPRESIAVSVDLLKLVYFARLHNESWCNDIVSKVKCREMQMLVLQQMQDVKDATALDIFNGLVYQKFQESPGWLDSPHFVEIIPFPGQPNSALNPEARISITRLPDSMHYTVNLILSLKRIVPLYYQEATTTTTIEHMNSDTTGPSLVHTRKPFKVDQQMPVSITTEMVANAVQQSALGYLVIPSNIPRHEYQEHGIYPAVGVEATRSVFDLIQGSI